MVVVHLTLVLLTLSAVVFSDIQGLRYILGGKELLDKKAVARDHLVVSVGLALILITGGIMFSDRVAYLLNEPKFLMKMVFVGALVVNGYFIGKLSEIASEMSFRNLSQNKKRQLLLSGGISTASWIGAVLLGLAL